MMRRLAHIAVLFAAAVLATACTLTQLAYSNVGLAYNNASSMLTWMVADYVEMSDDQKEFVRDRFTRAFAWHRSQELPEYRRFFEKVLKQAEDNITVQEAAEDHRELRTYYHRALDRLLPDMADFLLGMDSVQVKQMEKRFVKDNRKVLEDVEKDASDRIEKRLERFIVHLEQWTGPLNDAQRQMVAGYINASPDLTAERMVDRRYRQEATLAIVKSKPPRDQAIAELRRLLVDTESWRNPDYTRKLKARDVALFDLIARLSVSLNTEQRAAFQKRVRGFMRDITEISASRSATAGS